MHKAVALGTGVQSAPPYVNIYAGLSLDEALDLGIRNGSTSIPDPRADLLPRWQGPRGYGARHINDLVPFSLGNEDMQRYRLPNSLEMKCIQEKHDPNRLEFHSYDVAVKTSDTPKPVPLTVASLPTIIVRVGI